MDDVLGFALFESPLGALATAWSPRGIAGVFLPEASEGALRRRVALRFPSARESAPPEPVQRAIESIRRLLRGERAELRGIALDMQQVPELNQRIYAIAREIPPGQTLSYGALAARLGDRRLAREVGAAMARNPFSIVVPCHRILAADGKLGGFSARGGAATKLRLLSIEGVQMPGTEPLFASAGDGE
jgi:methylated-DNA-[protein]-cysteine S-methyltransferase